MLLEILVAAVIGISFGNAWACIFMSFGTSTGNRSVGKWFIAGRFLGLIFLGSLISLLRFAAQDVMPYILLIFGISTLIFGLFMLFKHFIGPHSKWKHHSAHLQKKHYETITMSLLSLLMVFPRYKTGEGGCKKKAHDHNDRGKCRKSNLEKKYGFALGVLRGAAPCIKVVVLAPLLVATGFPSSLLIILVYASTSTVYPIIGYLSADILSKFEKHQLTFKIIGAVILIAIGVYTIINAMMWGTVHSGI
jgi:cytochrome c biogenesis protein CcdA